MPIRRFRRAEEIPTPPARQPLDPDNLRVVLELCQLVYGLRPWKFPPGVHKSRSLEAANLQRTEWERNTTS